MNLASADNAVISRTTKNVCTSILALTREQSIVTVSGRNLAM